MRAVIVTLLCSFIIFINSSGVLAESVGAPIEMLPWEIVNEKLPKYSKFKILDLETGKIFNVQRRAGSRHADVQPLTSKDTKIMKEIYGGKWSWKRRAIIVLYQGQWIAASMNGMPHGAGSLKNNFPGHFCLFFYGSKTHRTNVSDFPHKLMILKAAGKLQEYISEAEPFELIEAFITGINQQDPHIIASVTLEQMNWEQQLQSVEGMKLVRMPTSDDNDQMKHFYLEVPVEVEWISNDFDKNHFKGNIHLFRSQPKDSWKIDGIRFLKDSQILKDIISE